MAKSIIFSANLKIDDANTGDTGDVIHSKNVNEFTLSLGKIPFPVASDCYWKTAYGNGRFVAVGDKIVYSDDGVSWTTALDNDIKWGSIAYGNGRFVAVPYMITPQSGHTEIGRVAYSDDGINWNEEYLLPDDHWLSVFYCGGRFVATSKNYVSYSDDGAQWTLLNNSNQMYTIIYKDMFVGVGPGGAMYSSDGINWINGNGMADLELYSIIYANEHFVAVGPNGAVYSSDGINWIKCDGLDYCSMNTVVYGDGRFVTGGRRSSSDYNYDLGPFTAYSVDGVSWVSTTEDDVDYIVDPQVYGNGMFLGDGYNDPYGEHLLAYSYDGVVWQSDALVEKGQNVSKEVAACVEPHLSSLKGLEEIVQFDYTSRWAGEDHILFEADEFLLLKNARFVEFNCVPIRANKYYTHLIFPLQIYDTTSNHIYTNHEVYLCKFSDNDARYELVIPQSLLNAIAYDMQVTMTFYK